MNQFSSISIQHMSTREIEIARGQNIVIHQLDRVYDSVTGRPLTGSWLWNSAVILSIWMTSHGQENFPLQGKSVIELGAGVGLPGLTAARLGASRVVLTDIEPLLPGLLKNVEVNGLGDRVEVRQLVWGSDASKLGELGEFDLVLMSDVFYDSEVVLGLAETLKSLCRRERIRIWAATEVRPFTGECLGVLMSRGFEVVELPSGLVAEGDRDLFAILELVPPRDLADGIQK